MDATSLLEEAQIHSSDPAWLNANADELHTLMAEIIRREDDVQRVIEPLLKLLPYMLERDDLKRWGRLLEAAYERTRFAESNGFDGEATRDLSGMFIFQKRPKVPQLPTKTTRRKRIILHPTQMFEIYLILLTARHLDRRNPLDDATVIEAMKLARVVSDPWCNAKLHQVLGYLYSLQHEFQRAIDYSLLSLDYWQRKNERVEQALCAITIGESYRMLARPDSDESVISSGVEILAAVEWIERAATLFGRTSYRWQYAVAALSAASAAMQQGDYDAAVQWADQALIEYADLGSPEHLANAQYTRGLAHAYADNLDAAWGDMTAALDAWGQLGREDRLIEVEYRMSMVEGKRGDEAGAVARLEGLLARLGALEPGTWREWMEREIAGFIDTINRGYLRRS